MPLINTSVPNLIQGVSQQPDATRFAGQCEEQVNALSSVAEGLKKRPNTRHIAKLLDTAIGANSFVHFVNRSASEKYVVIHDGYCLKAWNMDTGNEASIRFGNNIYKSSFTASEVTTHNANDTDGNPLNSTVYHATGYTPAAGTYLNTATPANLLKGLTVADTTFMLNTQKSVALNTAHTDALEKEALVLINQGDYKKKYQVNITVNPEAGTTSYVQATASVGLERYQYSYTTQSSSGWFNRTYTYTTYRWRIASVNISAPNDGSGYFSSNIAFSSNKATYTNANYTAVIDGTDGSIESAYPNNRGDYEGAGSTQTGYDFVYGATAPAITVSINPVSGANAGQAVSMSAHTYSGTSASGNNDKANTDSIAYWLTSDGDGSNYGSGVAMNESLTTNGVASLKISDYFTVSRTGSLIRLTKKLTWTGDFSISTTDSLGDTAMTAIYKEVSSISDLPVKCYNGFKCKVIGDTELSQDDYYVQFQTNDGGNVGTGSWIECEGFDIEKGFDSATMPFSLLNDNTDSFVLSELNFADRKAGDNLSNPNPSFVGNEITNMFFFKNRLGFLSRDNVIFSEAGLGGEDDLGVFSYNLYRTTVSSLLDSAPIDVSVSSRRVTTLESAVGFQENLILFSRSGQFVLKGGDLLTPKTISITPATNFDYDETVPPLPLGSYIYYPFKRGSFTGLREFTVNASTDNYDSAEITEHVPAYIPSNIIQMKGTTSEDIIALVSGNEPDTIYIYNYFWNNNQKVLSAWSKFTIAGEIRGMECIESNLFLVVALEGKTQLLNMPLNSGQVSADDFVSESSVDFGKLNVLLDERIEVRRLATTDKLEVKKADGNWSSAAADFPYSTSDATKYKFVTAAGETHVVGYNTNGFFLNDAGITPFYQINIYGYLGRTYDMEYKFSAQLFKASSGKGASPSAATAMTIRNGAVFFDETSEFTVKVTPEGRPMASNVFLASSRPDAETYNGVKFSEGFFRFPVHSKAKHANITLQNSSPFDCKFSSAEFESFVHPRSNRYG